MSPVKLVFFFSSRRRHTRWNCDWSSDVCSSDLAGKRNLVMQIGSHSCFGQGCQRDAAPSIVFRKILFELRGNGLQRSLGLAQAHLWLEPSDGKSVQESPVVEKLFGEPGENLGIHAGGNPDLLGTRESKCPFETFRRHADDGIRHGIQRQRFANFIFVRAQLVGPKAVTDDRYVVPTKLGIFVGQKKPSGGGAQAQHVKIVRADHLPIYLPGLGAATPRQWSRQDATDAGEHLVLLLIILKITKRQAQFCETGKSYLGLRVDRIYLDELGDILHRQRVQQDGIDYRKNRGVRADSERQ